MNFYLIKNFIILILLETGNIDFKRMSGIPFLNIHTECGSLMRKGNGVATEKIKGKFV